MGIFSKKFVAITLAAGIALIIIPRAADAKPLATYLADLQQTSKALKTFSDESVDFKDETMIRAADATLKQAVIVISKIDEIDYKNSTIPVDNSWLAREAAAFSRETDPDKKKQLVVSIGERIEAIAIQVESLEYASQRETTKDEEKSRLAGILKREEYKKAEDGAESPAARLYQAIEKWIASLFPKLKQPDPNKKANLTGLKTVLQILIFVLVAALLIFLIVKFGPQLIRKYRKVSKKTGGTKIILGEEIGPDRTTADLFAEAETLAGLGDIRGAIRKGYISLLFELSERRMIGLAKHKTNRDYLRDLVKHERVRANVGGLTQNYERHWYGRKEAEEHDWKEFREGYNDALGG